MLNPGIGDPYWFEWYVGLKYIIEMLNPDSGISCVIFQHEIYQTIDDVVVEYDNGTSQLCYQVKHEIATSQPDNLTFGKLLEKGENGKCLFEALFLGWKKASSGERTTIKPVLYTNRKILDRRAGRTYNGTKYSAYPVDQFLSLMQGIFENVKDYSNIVIREPALLHQWEEFCSALRIKKEDIPDAVDFLKRLTIQANQSGLVGVEQELLSALSSLFACNESLSNELLGKLVFALRKWTTTRREDARVTKEEVFSVLGTESDINESQHRLAPPFPFFKSRQAFCKIVEQKIRETDKRIVLLSGDPGSGKTSVISYLQSTSNFFLLRYHTFRPISPEQRFYDADAGICSSENLWGTLLIQLRQKLKGKLAEYEVPISNKLLTVEGMRSHVCRLLGRLAADQNRRIYVCIDGIDHAARANNVVSFLPSLPLSSEIPDGVCFVIVGQPIHLYQRQYPVWLSDGKLVEYLDMPKLCVEDIGQLITCKLPQFREVTDGLAKFIYERTEGNNLSAVFAIEEIKGAVSAEEAMGQLRDSRISSDIQQYYHHIWNYMRKAILDMGLLVAFPESVIACSILLMNGRVDTEILSAALQHKYNVSETEWRQILDKLYPLVVPSSKKGEYALFHNDFRIFLMGTINECKTLYRDIALALAEYLLHTENRLLKYVSAIPLLQCAERTDLVPTYFTAGFVINALAEGVSKQRLDDFLRISYAAACDNQDYEGYTNTYLAAKTLYQHESYFEYYERQYICNDYPELSLIDISEVRVLPARRETLHEYERVLTLCTKLYKADTKECSERASALYTNWFGKLSPYSFAGLCSEEEAPEDEAWKLRTTEIGFFLQNWGTSTAELGIVASVLEKPASQKEFYALLTFGEAYFTKCIDLRKPAMAVTAVECGFVSKTCFSKNLENIFYGGFANKFGSFLPQIELDQGTPSEKLLAMAMQVICQSEPEIEKAQLTPCENVQSIYDEISFSTVLRSFLLGYAECTLDDAVICGHTKEFFSFLEGNTQEKDQISRLARLAALLGKSYSKSKMSISDAFRRHVEWFLTSRLWRSIDYSRARRFLIFVLFQSPFVDSLADAEWFLSALKVQLFEIEYIGFYYKTDILGYLRRHKRLDIIREYILTLYGENCGRISQEENKADMHHQFLLFGEIVEPQMMIEFSNRLKWDVVGYSGHKEYAMQGLSDAFEIISNSKGEPQFWREAGTHLYQQSKIAARSNNKCDYEICENIVSAAVNCGIPDFWALHNWNDEFHMNPSLIEHALYGFVEQAEQIEDLEALWLLNCGLHSWYTQGNRLGSKSVYESCCKRAQEVGVDFRNEVEKVTPQWLKIIDYELRERNYRHEENDSTKQQSEDLSKICTEYEANTTDELMEVLPEVPLLHHAKKRYELIIDKLVSERSFTIDNARHVLDSVCSFIAGKEWEYERFDTILSSLLLRLGNEAFWRLAATIGLHLCDYNYQTSTRNMRVLLKLYCRHDAGQMKALFEKELSVHEQWVTGNHHIPVEFKLDLPQRTFEVPSNLAEMALYILIEQIGTHNARKIESAVFAVYKLGKSFPNLLDTVALNWDKISIAQKEFLLPVVTKWIFEDTNSKRLSDALLKDYMSCNLLPFKYYYHSILVRSKEIGLEKDQLTFEAVANEYALPVFGKYTKGGAYENFLSLVEHPDDAKSSNDIRRYIAQFSINELPREDEYGEPEDLRIPAWNQDISNVLYGEEKSGRWNSSSLLSKKSMLIPLEDPFLLTDMPQIVYDEEWFPDVPWSSHEEVKKGGLSIEELHDVVYKNIKSSEIPLAACIWYPWNYKDGCIFYELTQVKPAYDLSSNNQIDCCVGNFGLLTYEGDIEESHFACKRYDSINLFNKVGGNIKISFGNGQVIPSSAWRKIFHCEPSDESPYRWIDENGVEVLRLERIASPIREATREVYVRQPILFRWICNKEWLTQKLEELQLRVCFITSHERMPF